MHYSFTLQHLYIATVDPTFIIVARWTTADAVDMSCTAVPTLLNRVQHLEAVMGVISKDVSALSSRPIVRTLNEESVASSVSIISVSFSTAPDARVLTPATILLKSPLVMTAPNESTMMSVQRRRTLESTSL